MVKKPKSSKTAKKQGKAKEKVTIKSVVSRWSAKESRNEVVPNGSQAITLVRLELWESPPPNQEAENPIFIDLHLDSAGRKVGKWLVFGWQGIPNRRDEVCWPFVLDWTGRIDFGSSWESDWERYAKTDLFERQITKGQIVKFELSVGPCDYRIAEIHRLVN